VTRVMRRFINCILLSNQEEQDNRSMYYIAHVEKGIILKLRTNVARKYGGKSIFKVVGSCEHDNVHPVCITDSEFICQLNNC
jgi:hypothetical protein